MFPSMVKHGLSVIGPTMLTFAGHDIVIPTGEAKRQTEVTCYIQSLENED